MGYSSRPSNSRRSSSRLLDAALHKLFHRRASDYHKRDSPEPTDPYAIEPEVTIAEIKDHFYMYSQEQIEQQARDTRAALEALDIRRKSDSTEGSYSSAVSHKMGPVKRIKPYAVSHTEWILPSEDTCDLTKTVTIDDKIDTNGCDRLNSVLNVFTKVYSISKLVLVIFMNFGVDLDDSPTGLLTRVRQAEAIVTTTSVTNLIETVDALYYCVYARIMVELANTELTSMFNGIIRPQSSDTGFLLPGPRHVYNILLACKDILDYDSVCFVLDKQVIWKNQDEFNARAVVKMLDSDFLVSDIFGYRRSSMATLKDEDSSYNRKWRDLCWLYRKPLFETQTCMSEKYLATVPMTEIEQEFPTESLPFIDLVTVDANDWEREIIQDHRDSTLAKLEGKSLGQVRREELRRPLTTFCMERKCICMPYCKCAATCTQQVERACPCVEHMLRGLLAKRRNGPGYFSLDTRCTGLASVIFQTFSTWSREAAEAEGYVLTGEIDHALGLIGLEVLKQRDAADKANGLTNMF